MLETITKAFSHFPFPICWYMDRVNHTAKVSFNSWNLITMATSTF